MEYRILMIAFFLFSLLSCQRKESESSTPTSAYVENMFGGVENYTLIKEASSAQIVRLHLLPPPVDPENPNRSPARYVIDLANYEIGQSELISGSELGVFRSIIFDSTIDDPDSTKGCIPVFGVRVTFQDEDESLDVNFCFDCDLIWVSRNDVIVGGGDFDPVHEKLAKLVRPFFPDDGEIKQLE